MGGYSCGAKISPHAKNQPNRSKIGNFGILVGFMGFYPTVHPKKPENTPGESHDSQKHARTQKISPLPKIGPERLKNKGTGQHCLASFIMYTFDSIAYCCGFFTILASNSKF